MYTNFNTLKCLEGTYKVSIRIGIKTSLKQYKASYYNNMLRTCIL